LRVPCSPSSSSVFSKPLPPPRSTLFPYTTLFRSQDEVNFEQEILTQVRQFEMLRLQIDITRKSDEVAQERYNVAQNRYLIGRIDITNLNIALTEKDDAKRSYILALQSFWQAYYDLRRLTLYDFSTDRPLYIREGDE